jgi:putative endonuclease
MDALSLSKGIFNHKKYAICVYILECSDKSYYIGSTSDIAKRLEKHSAGKGAAWTAKRLPVRLIYQEQYKDKFEALNRERQLKGWSRAKKEALIKNDMDLLAKLSKAHSNRKITF